ncbi:bifunctional UDP-N-acetylglucosamine diphosphorylase/glucosamine-1-phosphate N-acetyltransferase GlmU [Oceanobacter mangrovi]|uniref:bifunctional UDP-N-acetylglucosamine diphosphorylase/glucosamine-1-phosphate N-acetyltransferase GlmU n=1 Tax=Oceanobacter mangrovi TaxID=2862510 RepID=UPI001C8E837F|nr:bifunctional UDP-N-acetylglucosamine diphosphorylase/glucosamine-1-phosphate N-acetyltransferase GlmU [Oceanobacter mangrovi]
MAHSREHHTPEHLAVVTLAAGKGSRMKSDLPKVLHKLAGKPMLQHVLDTAVQLGDASQHVVIGHGAEQVREAIRGNVIWALQQEQKGTGHAVAQALPDVDPQAVVLVLYGDVPLITVDTLHRLLAHTFTDSGAADALALLTVELDNPTGYGRIVRNADGQVQAIVEHKDANEQQRQIREVNTGILAVSAAALNRWLPLLSADNAQGEYYLTDIVALAVAEGKTVQAIQPQQEYEVQGVNDRLQMAALERIYQRQQADELMTLGVALADPARIDVRGSLIVGSDVSIDVGCVFEGEVILGNGVSVGPYCVIRNSEIAAGSSVEAYSHIDDASVDRNCAIGPYARLRPGADLATGARVGNFCEIKKARIGAGSKVNHLSYIGDAEVGEQVNIGAGTITCNYDGVNKSLTRIGDNAFIGSNTALVAPVTVGKGVTVGAGSVITNDVDDNQLAVARGKQRNIDGWQRPQKKS